jgi:uncharacterized BrkB/YihY/UPF0761 family membrane protein
VTYPMPPTSYRTLQPERTARPVKVWDVVLTVVFLVALVIAAPVATFAGAFLAMASDACGGGGCNEALLNFGVWFGVIEPWVVMLLALTASILLLVFRRVAFWVPLLGIVLMIAFWFVGAAIVGAAVGG